MTQINADQVRTAVRESYGKIAEGAGSSCCAPSCCAPSLEALPQRSRDIGYSEAQLAAVPEGANLGLGCGNPQAIAALKPGEVVLDLGSGGGFDCLLAAAQVGPEGAVIGVDMTPAMIALARESAAKAGAENVEFRLGEIEHLPVADGAVDVVISNCVVNLSPDKAAVYREAFRALKPGGRLAISDVITTAPLPPEVRADLDLLTSCIAGAASLEDIEGWLAEAGFQEVRISPKDSRALVRQWAPGANVEDYVCSANIEAIRP